VSEPPDRRLTREDMERLERALPANDRMGERLGVRTHYGSIEEAEEKRFPWLKRRRLRRYR